MTALLHRLTVNDHGVVAGRHGEDGIGSSVRLGADRNAQLAELLSHFSDHCPPSIPVFRSRSSTVVRCRAPTGTLTTTTE